MQKEAVFEARRNTQQDERKVKLLLVFRSCPSILSLYVPLETQAVVDASRAALGVADDHAMALVAARQVQLTDTVQTFCLVRSLSRGSWERCLLYPLTILTGRDGEDAEDGGDLSMSLSLSADEEPRERPKRR